MELIKFNSNDFKVISFNDNVLTNTGGEIKSNIEMKTNTESIECIAYTVFSFIY